MKSILQFFAQTALLVVALAVTGCGPGSTPVEVPQSTAAEALKQSLQGPADTGQMGSEMMVIEQNIDKLAAEDAAKGADLKKDFEQLKSAQGAAKVKAKAKEMMAKL